VAVLTIQQITIYLLLPLELGIKDLAVVAVGELRAPVESSQELQVVAMVERIAQVKMELQIVAAEAAVVEMQLQTIIKQAATAAQVIAA
jgi:hypothetical protein